MRLLVLKKFKSQRPASGTKRNADAPRSKISEVDDRAEQRQRVLVQSYLGTEDATQRNVNSRQTPSRHSRCVAFVPQAHLHFGYSSPADALSIYSTYCCMLILSSCFALPRPKDDA